MAKLTVKLGNWAFEGKDVPGDAQTAATTAAGQNPVIALKPTGYLVVKDGVAYMFTD